MTASKATRGRRIANASSELADAVREGVIRLTDAERICDDSALLAKLEQGGDIEKLAKKGGLRMPSLSKQLRRSQPLCGSRWKVKILGSTLRLSLMPRASSWARHTGG